MRLPVVLGLGEPAGKGTQICRPIATTESAIVDLGGGGEQGRNRADGASAEHLCLGRFPACPNKPGNQSPPTNLPELTSCLLVIGCGIERICQIALGRDFKQPVYP